MRSTSMSLDSFSFSLIGSNLIPLYLCPLLSSCGVSVISSLVFPKTFGSLTGDGKPAKSGSVLLCINVNGSLRDTSPPIVEINSFTCKNVRMNDWSEVLDLNKYLNYIKILLHPLNELFKNRVNQLHKLKSRKRWWWLQIIF